MRRPQPWFARHPGRAAMVALVLVGASESGWVPRAAGQTPFPTVAPPPPLAPAPAAPTPAQPAARPAPGSTSARRAERDAGPSVISAEAAALIRQKNARDDRYGGAGDWRDIPAWRQASFFGLRAEGKTFIFVVDRSGSMEDGDRLDRAKRELIRSIGAMRAPQRFQVIFYNDRATTLGDLPKAADYPSRNQLARWLNRIDAEGGTDPREALALALGQRPDAVFLLSDGAFPDGTPPAVAALNPRKVPIHCIDLAGGAGGDDLRIIARDSGGQYAASGR